MIVPIDEVVMMFHRCNSYIVTKYGDLMDYPNHLKALEQAWHSDQGVTIGHDVGIFTTLEFASEEDFLIWAVRWAG